MEVNHGREVMEQWYAGAGGGAGGGGVGGGVGVEGGEAKVKAKPSGSGCQQKSGFQPLRLASVTKVLVNDTGDNSQLTPGLLQQIPTLHVPVLVLVVLVIRVLHTILRITPYWEILQ